MSNRKNKDNPNSYISMFWSLLTAIEQISGVSQSKAESQEVKQKQQKRLFSDYFHCICKGNLQLLFLDVFVLL